MIFPLVIFVFFARKLISNLALPDFEVVRKTEWEETYGTENKLEVIQVMRKNFTINGGV